MRSRLDHLAVPNLGGLNTVCFSILPPIPRSSRIVQYLSPTGNGQTCNLMLDVSDPLKHRVISAQPGVKTSSDLKEDPKIKIRQLRLNDLKIKEIAFGKIPDLSRGKGSNFIPSEQDSSCQCSYQ